MTDLHLISWQRPKMTELVIKTIHRNTKRDNFRLVVLDNASDEKTTEMLQIMGDNGLIDELFLLKTNLGLEAARNFLLKQATTSRRFVCIDNDCLPPRPVNGQDWLEKMVELMEKYEDYAAISLRTQVMIGTGNIFEAAKKGDEIMEFPHPGGSFRIMDTGAVNQVGGWDRGDPGRGSEERYICGKLNKAGYKTAFTIYLQCLHLFGPKDTTDRWGYPANWKPEDTGHSDIWHPALANGDDPEELKKYAREEDIKRYFDVNSYNS